jgi:hypothetical protein
VKVGGSWLDRENKTLRVMIAMYCRGHHGERSEPLCAECRELLDYAQRRVASCPFGSEKGPCSRCQIHCYRPAMRDRIRDVMRYAGPRILKTHPALALRHLVQGWKHRSHSPEQSPRPKG